jgi:hypothetical protein
MRKIPVLALLLLTTVVVSAQRFDNPQIYERLELSTRQIERIEEVQRREDRVVREAQAELNVYKAQLERLLIDVEVDLRQAEKILRDTMEWKLKSEMAEIRRRVEVRKIMGEENWEEFLRMMRALRSRSERLPTPGPSERR